MADVSIKVTLEGAAAAQKALEAIPSAFNNINRSAAEFAVVQAHNRALLAETSKIVEQSGDRVNDLAKAFDQATTANARFDAQVRQYAATQARAIEENKKFGDQSKVTAQSTESLADSLGAMALRAAGTVISIGAVVGVLKEIYSAGVEANLAQIKLEAVLKSTGGTAGLTAQQLDNMVDSLAKGTRFDSTGIKEAMTILLTFGNVQGTVFEDTLKHAQNMVEMFGGSLSSAARTLGRAMNEPSMGIGRLSLMIGGLDPTLAKHIKDLGEAGRTAEAQAEIIAVLDTKWKDFAGTIGTSAPAAFDRLRISVGNLFEELGKGIDFGFFDMLKGAVDNLRILAAGKDVKLSTADAQKAIDELIAKSKTVVSPTERAEMVASAAAMQYELDAELQKESIDQFLAGITAKEAAEKDSATKRAALAEKQAKAAEARQKKERSEYEASVFRELELDDILIKQGKVTLNEKIAMIDFYLTHEAEGTALSIRLIQMREQAIDEQLKKELAARTLLGKVQEDAIAKGEKDYKKEQDAKTKALTQQMDDEIAMTRKVVFATNDLRTAAIEELAMAYINMGMDAEVAYEKVRKALENVKTQAELDTERISKIMGSASFDTIEVWGGAFKSIESGFAGILKGTSTLGEGIKAIWVGIADAIIQEISRVAANWILTMAGMGGGGGFLGGLFGGATGGGLFSGLGELFTGDFATVLLALQHGGEHVVTSPTMFMAGELGPERVAVSPLAGGGVRGSGGGITNIFNGPTIMDAYTMTLWLRGQQRMLSQSMR